MQRNYRGWESSGAELDSLWTGIMGVSAKFPSLPHGCSPSRHDSDHTSLASASLVKC